MQIKTFIHPARSEDGPPVLGEAAGAQLARGVRQGPQGLGRTGAGSWARLALVVLVICPLSN